MSKVGCCLTYCQAVGQVRANLGEPKHGLPCRMPAGVVKRTCAVWRCLSLAGPRAPACCVHPMGLPAPCQAGRRRWVRCCTAPSRQLHRPVCGGTAQSRQLRRWVRCCTAKQDAQVGVSSGSSRQAEHCVVLVCLDAHGPPCCLMHEPATLAAGAILSECSLHATMPATLAAGAILSECSLHATMPLRGAVCACRLAERDLRHHADVAGRHRPVCAQPSEGPQRHVLPLGQRAGYHRP